MVLRSLDKYRDIGLLILRVGIGIMFIGHGYPKLTGGIEVWTKVGGALAVLGIDFAPAFMGFAAALAEFGGGILLLLGLLTRPACFFLFVTMVVAGTMHISKGDGFTKYSHAVEAGILFFSLLFVGPGKFSIDEALTKKLSQTKDTR